MKTVKVLVHETKVTKHDIDKVDQVEGSHANKYQEDNTFRKTYVYLPQKSIMTIRYR